jgi:hypothetical protein
VVVPRAASTENVWRRKIERSENVISEECRMPHGGCRWRAVHFGNVEPVQAANASLQA